MGTLFRFLNIRNHQLLIYGLGGHDDAKILYQGQTNLKRNKSKEKYWVLATQQVPRALWRVDISPSHESFSHFVHNCKYLLIDALTDILRLLSFCTSGDCRQLHLVSISWSPKCAAMSRNHDLDNCIFIAADNVGEHFCGFLAKRKSHVIFLPYCCLAPAMRGSNHNHQSPFILSQKRYLQSYHIKKSCIFEWKIHLLACWQTVSLSIKGYLSSGVIAALGNYRVMRLIRTLCHCVSVALCFWVMPLCHCATVLL